MLTKIVYNREVTDEGDYIQSADILLNKLAEIDSNNINFFVNKKKLKIKAVEQSGREVHVDFPIQSSLATLSFDPKRFVNKFSYPQINVKINNDDTSYLISFKQDKFVDDFSMNIFQHGNGQIAYYQYGTGTSATKRPLVVFLHGSGERGFGDKYPLLGNDVPKTIHDYIDSHEDAVFLAPQASWSKELNGWFRPEIRQALIKLIRGVMDDENIDNKRVYLIGLSNGGAATWHFAENYPKLFTAIVPCCGYIYNDDKEFIQNEGKGRYMKPSLKEAKALANMPIWAFHALNDPTVDVRGTIETTELIKKQGNHNIRMTLYKNGEVKPNPHASWKLAFNNPQLLPWLFDQRKM